MSRTNQYLFFNQENKIKISVEENDLTFISETIEIKTVGINGQINLECTDSKVEDQF